MINFIVITVLTQLHSFSLYNKLVLQERINTYYVSTKYCEMWLVYYVFT